MRLRYLISTLIVIGLNICTCIAHEGMWLPVLLQQQNIDDMQAKGLKLSAEDIYSINQACLKDAVVLFGRGCTGEIISDEGLMLTNYHCGHYFIRSHSKADQDYLKKGFWAKNRDEELSNKGLSASILNRMEDVTNMILKDLSEDLNEDYRNNIIESRIGLFVDSIESNTHYNAEISSLYYGNEYYLFIYEKFNDVRLVGAPPNSIGSFGGDTDNWIWPRHTGDFTVFRIYADSNNLPAEYSPGNVPYHPKKSLSISLKGIHEGDFTMVYGYPYVTSEYITSFEVDNLLNEKLPQKIKLRRGRLDIIEEAMYSDTELYLKFASEQAIVANAWKKWIGMEKGLTQRNAVEVKQQFERQFSNWTDSINNEGYEGLIDQYESAVNELRKLDLVYEYGNEAVMASGLLEFVSSFIGVLNDYFSYKDKDEAISKLEKMSEGHFNLIYSPVEKESFTWLMSCFYKDISPSFHPLAFSKIKSKYNDNFSTYTDYVYSASIFTDKEKMDKFLAQPSGKALENDPLYELYMGFAEVYSSQVYPQYFLIRSKIDSLNRKYMKAILEMNSGKLIYPDANGSLRITYGKAEGYEALDAVRYNYISTLAGVLQKEDTTIYDYKVSDKLKKLYENKDYGHYGIDSIMPVCFIASNHTSGGNSGSPVLDAEGHLIGVNFDRNWEGTMSDIMYDPEICRNICVDIRYVLFVIDKFAGAGYLLEEMNIIE